MYANYSFILKVYAKILPIFLGVRKFFIPFEGVRKNIPLIQGVRICIKIGVLFHFSTIASIQYNILNKHINLNKLGDNLTKITLVNDLHHCPRVFFIALFNYS